MTDKFENLLKQAELNGFCKIPTPPKFEDVLLYSKAKYKAECPNSVFADPYNFVLVGIECNEGINTAEDLKAALPPMGV